VRRRLQDGSLRALTASWTVPLTEIPYLDFPELKFNENESTEMPFRYVKGADGEPVMPEVFVLCLCAAALADVVKGMVDLIKQDADKAIDDLF